MNFNNILTCKNKKEFYNWLKEHHTTQDECWIECKKGYIKDDDVFYYTDAVYVALCFGWIDSVSMKKDGVRLQRFSPRKKNSSWGELNKERCRWLIKHGYMTENGYKTLPDFDEEFVIDEDILEKLKEDDETWNNFCSFPELYRRIRIANIQKQRKDPEVFNRMLNNFLQKTKENKIYGDYTDQGRLLK